MVIQRRSLYIMFTKLFVSFQGFKSTSFSIARFNSFLTSYTFFSVVAVLQELTVFFLHITVLVLGLWDLYDNISCTNSWTLFSGLVILNKFFEFLISVKNCYEFLSC